MGIALNSVKFGEGHKILTLFTETHGKIDASAFGARKTKSKFGSSLEPFTISTFLLYRKSQENPYTIREVDVSSYNTAIREDLDKFFIGNAILEPIIRFVEKAQTDRNLYNLVTSALEVLNEISSAKSGYLLSMYDIQFLSIMGYRPDANVCVNCGNRISKEHIYTDINFGFPLCENCRTRGSLPVPEGAVRFIQWVHYRPLLYAEKVTMNKKTFYNIRSVIEHIYLNNFRKLPESWSQLKELFEHHR